MAVADEARSTHAARSPAYRRIEEGIAAQRCIVLDGGVATELQKVRAGGRPEPELWGTGALYRAPQKVLSVHRAYAETGCDVISTNTWSILSAAEVKPHAPGGEVRHWMDVARLSVRLVRQAIADAGRGGECAVAFTISEEVNSPSRRETVELLQRVFEDEPPDMILLETLTLIREPTTFDTVELLLQTGLPVWLSFRRCRHGVCGVFGQHWGPPEGDVFGRAARRLEAMGVGALLINCLPVEHVAGMVSWLRDYTGLPLGAYPNLGHLAGSAWRFDDRTDPAAFAELSLGWREEGAQILGGCCGVGPEHIAALVGALTGTRPGRKRPALDARILREEELGVTPPAPPWQDERGRVLYPLPFPALSVNNSTFVPTHGSYLVWKSLFRTGAGEGGTCLDVGCGCGILSVQLALNGARRVHAIDIDREAVADTFSNAFRNGVSDRVTGEAVDLYEWEPTERYDLIVASLFQMPVDPFEAPSGHRPLDYWGRNLYDHFLELLPRLLSDEGRALVMQLSILGQAQTESLLAAGGLSATVADFSFFPFGPLFVRNKEQITRVEELSDAHHLDVGEDVMVAYLLDIGRTG